MSDHEDAGESVMDAYIPKFPELWKAGLVEGVDYQIRGVYRFIDENGEPMVRVDRFPIDNVIDFKPKDESSGTISS